MFRSSSQSRRVALAVLFFVPLVSIDCFRDPDPVKTACTRSDFCPSGYVCSISPGKTVGHCCKSANGSACTAEDAAQAVDSTTADALSIGTKETGVVDSTPADLATSILTDSNLQGGAGGNLGGTDGPGGAGGAGGMVGGHGGSIGSTEDGGSSLDTNQIDARTFETGSDLPLATGGVTGSIDAGDTPLTNVGGSGGMGGTTSSGGIATSGGATGAGGMAATGGTSGGASGSGGSTACQDGSSKCSGNGVQSCSNGQWGTTAPCGPRQTCTGDNGNAKCICNADPVCTVVGGTCASTSTLATCSQDADTCLYESSAMTCANGACSGSAGAASCCTNACTLGAKQCLSNTSIQTCQTAATGCTAFATSTCQNGACTGSPGSASCCTNACTDGSTQCLSGTTLQTCAVGSNGCTTESSSSCSSGLVCERYGTAACLDPDWAEWPMPSSQADVTAGAPNLESYTDNGDGTVTDNVTGLMWQQATAAGTYTWASAVAYCPTLTLGGRTDWRLPTRIELVSIVDFGTVSPAINIAFFPGTAATGDLYWSSTTAVLASASAWGISGRDGAAHYDTTSHSYYVRCVR
jgi:Protein of unknown function (DUF1566)